MRRPAFYALVFFVIGILIGSHLDLPASLLLSILILSLLFCLLFLLKKDQKDATVFIILSIILAGFFRYELLTRDFPQNHISNFLNLNRSVIITGKIADQPDVRVNKTFLKVQAQTLSTGKKTKATSGQIILKIKEPTFRFDYADRIKFKGFLYEPSPVRNPGAFDYKRYLGRKGIHGIVALSKAEKVQILGKQPGGVLLSKIIIPLRKWILGVFDKTLSGNHKALLSGFLLGETRDIPEDIYDMFRDTGTVHLLVVSGSNVWLVVGIIFALLSLLRVPKIPTTIITLICIFIFSNLVHNDPPVVRAGIMASVVLLGVLLYKDVQMINLVSFSALVILLFSPLFLFDVGFQLSFASVFAIVLLVPKLSEVLSKYVSKSHKRLWRGVILGDYSIPHSGLLFQFRSHDCGRREPVHRPFGKSIRCVCLFHLILCHLQLRLSKHLLCLQLALSASYSEAQHLLCHLAHNETDRRFPLDCDLHRLLSVHMAFAQPHSPEAKSHHFFPGDIWKCLCLERAVIKRQPSSEADFLGCWAGELRCYKAP
jgi:competence protein ComEC